MPALARTRESRSPNRGAGARPGERDHRRRRRPRRAHDPDRGRLGAHRRHDRPAARGKTGGRGHAPLGQVPPLEPGHVHQPEADRGRRRGRQEGRRARRRAVDASR